MKAVSHNFHYHINNLNVEKQKLYFNYIATKFGSSMNAYIYTYIGVSNLRNCATTNTTITIIWDPAVSPSDCGPVLYYNVIATSLADASDRNTIVTSQTIAGLSGLRNDTSYNISVAAVNKAGSGLSSTIIVTDNSIGKEFLMFICRYI